MPGGARRARVSAYTPVPGQSPVARVGDFEVAAGDIKVSDRPPADYLADVLTQCETGELKYDAINKHEELVINLDTHCSLARAIHRSSERHVLPVISNWTGRPVFF